jgi:protein involved in polysaccharide export with SLBB domain
MMKPTFSCSPHRRTPASKGQTCAPRVGPPLAGGATLTGHSQPQPVPAPIHPGGRGLLAVVLGLWCMAIGGGTWAQESGFDPGRFAEESLAPAPALMPFRTSPAGYEADAVYRLRPGDRLIFQVLAGDRENPDVLREDPDARTPLTVSDSGEIDVPYLGRLTAQDRTCHELVEGIKRGLEETFFYHATVILALDTVGTRDLGRVYVSGQVVRQGPIQIPPGEILTVSKVILRAGGFANFANKRAVQVTRRNADGQEQRFELNMQDVIERGMLHRDMELQSDDFVTVPARAFNF